MTSPRFSIATTISLVLHLAFAVVLMLEHHSERASQSQRVPEPEFLAVGQGEAAPPGVDAVPVELEDPSQTENHPLARPSEVERIDPPLPNPPSLHDLKSAPAHAAPTPPTERGHRSKRASASDQPHRRNAPVPSGRKAPKNEPLAVIGHDAVNSSTQPQVISHGALREAMQAAAASSASSGAIATVPIVRVDPRETNLDRAWSRAFAWAFATDRSFFSATPVGKARFVLELNTAGAISDVFWAEPRPSPRIKELVLRMVRLLSQNRFSMPMTAGESSPRRGFEMIVTESHVEVPKQIAASGSQVGDLWMLGAGEPPTLSQPSHPSVADVTGRKVSCSLRILDPLPTAK